MTTPLPNLETCTECGHEFSLATAAFERDAKPKPGDLTLCIECGHIYQFDDRLHMIEPPAGLMVELPEATRNELNGARFAIAIARAQRAS